MIPALFLLAGLAVLIVSFLIWWGGDYTVNSNRNPLFHTNIIQDSLEIMHADEHGKIDKEKEPVVFYMALIPFAAFGVWLIYKAFVMKFGGGHDPLD